MADVGYTENTNTYVEWNKLNSIGEDLINYSTTDIQNQIDKIQNLRKKVNWEGADAESSLKGFDEFMTEMGKVTQGIKQYGQFLKKYILHRFHTITNTFFLQCLKIKIN